MLSERDGGDMDTPSEPPAAPEDGSIPADKYRSPYIRTQTIKLLKDTAEPKTCLSAGSSQNQRTDGDDASKGKEHGSDPWKVISREDFLRGLVFDINGLRRFNRLVVTSDAGMGKSTLLDWICWEFNSPDGDSLAIRLRASDLGKSFENKEDLLASTITASENGPPGLLVSQLKRRRDNDEASLTLRRLRSNGRLVLLIDGLDELPENNHACAAIEYLATDPQWRKCLIMVAGRRYAVESQWNKLFPRGNADGWSFILVGELTEPEQEEYLGPTLFKRVNEIASDLLAVPRSLYYLRRYVTNPEGIRTASDVYLTAVVRLVTDGFQSGVPGGGKAAGCLDESGKPILDKEQALKLLSAFAYHLTVVRGHFAEVGANEDVQAIGQLCGISSDESINANYVTQGLRCLSALNGPLRHDLLEGNGVSGFLHFRNKQLQEFLAGLWMSKWLREDQLESLKARLPLSCDKSSQTWYWTFRFAAEMPVRSLAPKENFLGRSDIAWLRSMQTVFCRGDGTREGTRRSTEMIVRAWPTLWEYVQSGNATAVSLCARWRGEFQEMLDDVRAEGHALAREFTQSFAKIPGGTLKMGSPTTDGASFPNEPKEIPIEIGKFSISRFPMLNGYYLLFDPGHGVSTRDRKLPRSSVKYSAVNPSSRHPVVDVSWWDARAASLWFYWKEEVEGSEKSKEDVSDKSKKVELFYGTRLPTESELEWVAKDGAEVYQRYPWGDSFSDVYCVPRGGNGTASLPALSSASNHPRATRRWQIVDIVGNVWQWCDNVYVDDVKTAADCKRTEGGPSRAVRGGGWRGSAGSCRSALRIRFSPGYRFDILGFRLALVPSRES
jgi:formylglycine-generating enzyme required for sulfatase activity